MVNLSEELTEVKILLVSLDVGYTATLATQAVVDRVLHVAEAPSAQSGWGGQPGTLAPRPPLATLTPLATPTVVVAGVPRVAELTGWPGDAGGRGGGDEFHFISQVLRFTHENMIAYK